MAIQKKLYTVEEFERWMSLPEQAGRRFELLDGEIIEVPSNPYSSQIAAFIIAALLAFVRPRKLGHVTGEGGGYIVAGARLAPDVAFVSIARQESLAKQGYNPVAPDLAVEVVSPTDEPDDIEKKLKKYMAANVLVWLVYPEWRRVDVYEPGQTVKSVGLDGTLDGGKVLPGFTLAVRDIFPE